MRVLAMYLAFGIFAAVTLAGCVSPDSGVHSDRSVIQLAISAEVARDVVGYGADLDYRVEEYGYLGRGEAESGDPFEAAYLYTTTSGSATGSRRANHRVFVVSSAGRIHFIAHIPDGVDLAGSGVERASLRLTLSGGEMANIYIRDFEDIRVRPRRVFGIIEVDDEASGETEGYRLKQAMKTGTLCGQCVGVCLATPGTAHPRFPSYPAGSKTVSDTVSSDSLR